ncbi:MAG: hypothetical protein LBP53_05835 [Candidatus Peribacteria bacterium]|nr:hypothetical protein [Candidatus Peribacteria bacterium]
MQQLKKLFTSCANHHKNPSIQQACTNFLETSFPLLEHQRRSYRAEELQIPIS